MNNDYRKEVNATITIEENIMKFGNSVVQLSNVSCLKIAPMPKKAYPIWSFIAVILGLLLFSKSALLGFALLAIGIGVIAYTYFSNSSLGSYLIVNMNSGENFFFACNDHNFLARAEKEIMKCFNDKGRSIISFQNCNIDSSQIGTDNSSYISR